MITSRKLRQKLEEVMDMLISNYTPAQWDAKNAIDVARYKEAKKVFVEADDAIGLCDVDWDNDDADDDYEAIAQLMDRLGCEIEMMEEDLNVYLVNE